MSQYQIKVSKPNHSVDLAGYDELAFTSEFPLLKVYKHGYHQIILNESYSSDFTTYVLKGGIAIPHNLKKKPMFVAYTQYHTAEANNTKVSQFKQFSWIDIIGTFDPESAVLNFNKYQAYSTDKYLFLNWHITDSLSPQTRLDFFYFIFAEPLAQEDYNLVGDGFAGNSIAGQGIVGKPFNF